MKIRYNALFFQSAIFFSFSSIVKTWGPRENHWLAAGQWFSLGPQVFTTNKTDRQNITEILLKVALNTIKQTNKHGHDSPC
jgi:hypothetical protein